MEYAKGTPRSVTVTEGKTRTFTAGPPLATTRTGELPEIGKCFQEKQIRCILRREGAPPDISRGDRGGRRGYCFRRAYRRICLLSRKRSVDSEFLCRHGRYTSKTLSVKRLSSQRTRRPPREAEFGLRVAGAGSAFFGENLLLFSFRMGQLGVYCILESGYGYTVQYATWRLREGTAEADSSGGERGKGCSLVRRRPIGRVPGNRLTCV